MLVFDDNMLKQKKMLEALLRVSVENRQENLEKYKNIVMKIDEQAFTSLLNELKQINDHNQTLEDELQFMEMVSDYYNQLYELQLSFKEVCELYGDNDLQLSDLSQIDIDYINNRKNLIEGYLVNSKNIDANKKKLEKLNDSLIEEEKTRMLLSRRLLEYEEILRKNFENAEGRIIVDGKLQYISVISEYKELDYDFKILLYDKDMLKQLLSKVSEDRLEIDEKYKTAEICYNSNPSVDSKHILDDISKEFFKVRYRLTMLKILELLVEDYDSCELFKEKREKLLDLIKYRVVCLKNLGQRISIDPFTRTKIEEQLNATSLMLDNSKKISKIKKEISELSSFVDEMISQNRDYRIDLNETKDLIIDTVSMEDMVSLVDIPDSVYFEEQRVSDNQVVSMKDVTDNFNMSIVRQKTGSVIKRVNQMMSGNEVTESDDKIEIVSPELVIVGQPLDEVVVDNMEETKEDDTISDELLDVTQFDDITLTNDFDDDKIDVEDVVVQEDDAELTLKDEEDNNSISNSYDSSIFETVDPFVSMPLFEDRTDEDDLNVSEELVDIEDSKEDNEELKIIEEDEDINLEIKEEPEDEVPDAFWITQSEDDVNASQDKTIENVVLSFDEQINALLSDKEKTKIKKLSA